MVNRCGWGICNTDSGYRERTGNGKYLFRLLNLNKTANNVGAVIWFNPSPKENGYNTLINLSFHGLKQNVYVILKMVKLASPC